MRKAKALALGTAGALLGAACWVYSRRTRGRASGNHEALDSPEVAQAFGRIARLPPMWLMRWYVARRAVAMVRAGQGVDLGCGPGQLVVKLAQAAPELQVTGIELSDAMLGEAEINARRRGLAERVSFKKGDAADIPYPDNSLDLVVSTLSLHHLHDPVSVMTEIARVLRHPDPAQGRPGGSYLVFDLRRDMAAPFYLLVWFVTRCIVPRALRRVNEPLGSRDAAYTPEEVACLAGKSELPGWHVTAGPMWLTLEGSGG